MGCLLIQFQSHIRPLVLIRFLLDFALHCNQIFTVFIFKAYKNRQDIFKMMRLSCLAKLSHKILIIFLVLITNWYEISTSIFNFSVISAVIRFEKSLVMTFLFNIILNESIKQIKCYQRNFILY